MECSGGLTNDVVNTGRLGERRREEAKDEEGRGKGGGDKKIGKTRGCDFAKEQSVERETRSCTGWRVIKDRKKITLRRNKNANGIIQLHLILTIV